MIINAHTHKIDSSADVNCVSFFHSDAIADKTSTRLVSCGIHPWHINTANIDLGLQLLDTYCSDKKIDAIGECGLDKFIKNTDIQVAVFVKQIELSEKYELPLIIHSVKMHHLILEYRVKFKAKQPWVLHGYNGSYQTAKQLVAKGVYLSFGASLLNNSAKLEETMKNIDQNYMLFETDDSDLLVSDVYKKAQSLLNLPPDLLEDQISKNFSRVFGK
ncbi:TatD family hydrolase [Saccharicrinis aurantiacus]|uniref:TatD family hydrolase n=1 Tax=Saccharicrinis aurantiacus TaxID=1849719 RepID=UPI00095016FD|nr:TatD family hydrolase [Saccharicrinis aurantiacus]